MDAATLKKIPLFADLDDEGLRSVSTWAGERSVSEGETLVREGDFAYDFFAIEDGTAEVTREGEHLADLGPGDIFGEAGVLRDQHRNATVTAKSSMRVLTLNHWDLDKLRKQLPGFDDRLQSAMEEHLRAG
jgi:cAMP-dependent protein kinase regulator